MPPPPSPHFLFFLLIFTFASFHYLTPCSGSDGISCPETEKQALLGFKHCMNDTVFLMSSWEPQADCCMWEHVVCSNLTGHVLELHLQNPGVVFDPGMNGTLDDSLHNLTHLRYLDLSGSRFDGAVPAVIGSFQNLEHLDLSSTGFNGTLDDSLHNLTHLRYLDLSGNRFEGAIPAFIGSFQNLEHLDLSGTGFNGTLDDSLHNLTHLRYLDLSWNHFEGAIPAFIGSFPRLEHLDLHETGFNGTLDDSLHNLTHLRYLDLSRTHFEGAIPAFIGSFPRLEHLDLSDAGFHGTIPPTLGNLSSLSTLVFQGQYEADSLEWMTGLSHLEHLELDVVNLSRATDWLQVLNTLPSLADLTLSETTIPYSYVPVNEVNFSSLTELSLSNINFPVFPSWILQINKLTDLVLHYIRFPLVIPNSASNLINLQSLEIFSSPNFTSIPDWILGCKSLEFFQMSYGSLQGSIPSAIGNLTSLQILRFYHNDDLSGEIPSEITKLCNIREITLSDNKLQGDISHAFRNMSNCFLESLEILDLSGNQLTGSIPSSLGKLFSLRELNLEHNKFCGNLPESMGQLYNLERFSVSDNMLQGDVGENHFANLTSLISFTASRNNLTLKVGTSWVPTFRVSTLELQSWNLGGGAEIPTWLNVQRGHLQRLDLSNSGIAHQFASWFWEIQNLNLSHNQLRGGIPDSISHFDGYSPSTIYLGNNLFNGSLPRIGREVTALDLSNNLFSGGLDHFLCDDSNDEFNLEILDLGKNLLSGKIPDCWMKWTSIKLLNLGNNNLSGHIPYSIGLLVNMWSLDMKNNKLSGQIPSSVQNCSELAKIDLAYNLLTGNLPTPLGVHLPRLGILILRSNMLRGHISPDICDLVSLQILDLSNNKFYGIIPSCVERFIPMVSKKWYLDDPGRKTKFFYWSYAGISYIDTADVAAKGSNLPYDNTLGYVTNFDLSNNNLSGEIPEQLTRLVELRFLNLSGNHLGGIIPHGIGDMKELESLDLSRNSLTGDIPETLAVLTSLNYLNVSYNNLSGRIPQSTQIMGFPSSGFIGNQLCGHPLPSNCNDDGVTSTTRSQGYDEDGKSEVEWLYVFSALGYAVGLAAVCNALIFKKEWRYAFFGSVDNIWNKIYVYASIKVSRRG